MLASLEIMSWPEGIATKLNIVNANNKMKARAGLFNIFPFPILLPWIFDKFWVRSAKTIYIHFIVGITNRDPRGSLD
jgi:hypothetical protein